MKIVACLATAIAFVAHAHACQTPTLDNGGMPYVSQDGKLKCCFKMAVPAPVAAPATSSSGLPYIDQDGNLKCCFKEGTHTNGSVNLMETSTVNMPFHQDQHMPYLDANGKVKCCFKREQNDGNDRVPYMDKHGNLKCCFKRSEIAHIMGDSTDMPYEDANGNLKCCFNSADSGNKWPVFLPARVE